VLIFAASKTPIPLAECPHTAYNCYCFHCHTNSTNSPHQLLLPLVLLHTHRVSDNVNLPFRLIPAVQEEGRARVTINLKLSAQFSYKLFAENVVIKVPVPNNTARCKLKVGAGRAKYEPEQRAIVWRIKRFAGMTESTFSADVELTPSIREKAWSRPPIQVYIVIWCDICSVMLCSVVVAR
jgi:Adaptor complexes medium subunit family